MVGRKRTISVTRNSKGTMMSFYHDKGFESMLVPMRSIWDDDILNDDRVKRVLKSHRRFCHVREFNAGGGDWETFCRSVQMLADFYKPGGSQIAFRDGIVEAANICITLRPYSPQSNRMADMRAALNAGIDVGMLSGLIYIPFLVAWCAVCCVKGATVSACMQLWDDDETARTMLSISFKCFDKLEEIRYTSSQVFGKYEHPVNQTP